MTSTARYLSALDREVGTVLDLLGEAGHDGQGAPVPACPGWNVRQVVGHLGGVHRMVIQAVREGTGSRSEAHLPGPDEDLPAWLRAGADVLLTALDTDPATPAWTFVRSRRTVGFWQLRQVLETAVHRVDLQQALGRPGTVDPEPAAEGVTEVVELLAPLRARAGVVSLDGSLTLRATDTGQSWTLGEGRPAGSATGTAADLFLVLWKRLPVPTLRTEGEAERMLELPLVP